MARSIIGVMVMTALNSLVKIDAEDKGQQFTKFYPATGDCDVLNSYIYDMMHNTELIKSPIATVAYAPAYVPAQPVPNAQPAPATAPAPAPVPTPVPTVIAPIVTAPAPVAPPAVQKYDKDNASDEIRATVSAWLAEACGLQAGQQLPTCVGSRIAELKQALHGQPVLVNGQVINEAMAIKTWFVGIVRSMVPQI